MRTKYVYILKDFKISREVIQLYGKLFIFATFKPIRGIKQQPQSKAAYFVPGA